MHVSKFVQILVTVIDLVMVEDNHAQTPVYLVIGAIKDATEASSSLYKIATNNHVVSFYLLKIVRMTHMIRAIC